MQTRGTISNLAALALAASLLACSAGYEEDNYSAGSEVEFSSIEEDLTSCDEPFSDNRLMADLAVAAARELLRWEESDFEAYRVRRREWHVRLSAEGNSRCMDGCPNVNAILAMQRSASRGIDGHNPGTFRNMLLESFARQRSWDSNNTIPRHRFVKGTDVVKNRGGCGKHYSWRVKHADSSRNYRDDMFRLNDKLHMFGYPDNPWLAPRWSTTRFAVDPAGGMTGGGRSRSGSCTVGSPIFDTTRSSDGKCCVSNGRMGNLEVTSFSPYIYTCEY